MASQSNPPAIHLSEEEDLGHSHFVRFDDEYTHPDHLGKGKDRQTHSPVSEDDTSYPPINEDAEETRRIEENLKRWEIAERQRRKAARGSSTSTSSASLVTDVSRRASLLWSGRKTRNSSLGGIGTHTALTSRDNIDIVPLNDINTSPTPSPTHSDFDSTQLVDPFSNPSESASPFADPHSPPPRDPSTSALPPINAFSPTGTLISSHPPPQPLNLPPPRTPPPTTDSPDPLFSVDPPPSEEDTKPVRWWHEWLCGCGEGPDRGGDHQAGRTNPFE
ncbi:hypothetical protein HYPSUDRAFT_204208 [Hypholoma sublateritium FD-334 SS-4]|uniref:Uncharacterized protein n=1 Tax=Hypholoma sublateritium (strain FD-334 SS-4) TaxID=945553 RepID=A0A0D2KZR6_HYPSF|nr:hypothetical protein HYPSUDRAFT_204208 [Hypholoma sublateritium FD-334 SS-4]